MNVVGILCLVSLVLLTWVVMLKLEVDSLQRRLSEELDPTPREDRPMQVLTKQKGLRSFTIDNGN